MSSFRHTYKNTRINLLTGDITKLKVDAVVNPANSSMVMGGGVAGAIKRVGGAEIEEEAVKRSPVKVGEAIATKGYRLSARFVIHAPTMIHPAMRTNEKNVQRAMQAALKCAQDLKISSLAFPGLGTGVGGVSMEAAARIMIQELKTHLEKPPTLNEVILVSLRDDATAEFEKAFLNVFRSVG